MYKISAVLCDDFFSSVSYFLIGKNFGRQKFQRKKFFRWTKFRQFCTTNFSVSYFPMHPNSTCFEFKLTKYFGDFQFCSPKVNKFGTLLILINVRLECKKVINEMIFSLAQALCVMGPRLKINGSGIFWASVTKGLLIISFVSGALGEEIPPGRPRAAEIRAGVKRAGVEKPVFWLKNSKKRR